MSQFPLSTKAMRGDGWLARDNLHELRLDTGRLADSIIADAYINKDTVLSGDQIYNNLTILGGALLDASGYNITVMGVLTIKSSRLYAASVDCGNLVIQRRVGDASYTNIYSVTNTICHANASINSVLWTFNGTQKFGGNLLLSNISLESSFYKNNAYVDLRVKGNFYFPTIGNINRNAAAYGTSPWFGYVPYFWIRAGGHLDLSGLTSFSANGGRTTTASYEYWAGGDAGALILAAGGNLLLGTGLNISTIGKEAHWITGAGIDGGDGGNVGIYRGGTLTGSIASVACTGGLGAGGGANGANGVYTNLAAIEGNHMPYAPTIVTEDDAIASQLTWNVPVDQNGDALHFNIEIERKYTEVLFDPAVKHESNVAPAMFSGAPPYTEGTGTVTYTPLATITEGEWYRYRVLSKKYNNSANTSIPSVWREFFYQT